MTTPNNAALGPNIHVSQHPVLSHKITILRSSQTPPGTFRAVLKEISYHLGYEATSALTTTTVDVSVPIPNSDGHFDYHGQKLNQNIALVPILRSGLGMTEPMLELLPNSTVYHIGMYKAIGQTTPIMYFNRLPKQCNTDVAYILDPVIATSASVMSLIRILKKWGAPKIHVISVIASRSGLLQIQKEEPDVHITVGIIDETVTDDGIINPGLGDAGDRLFGTNMVIEDVESLVHPTKRRKMTE